MLIVDAEDLNLINYVEQFLGTILPKTTENFVWIYPKYEDERSLISGADFYIANRDPRTITRSEFADEYGVKILSAVDTHGF